MGAWSAKIERHIVRQQCKVVHFNVCLCVARYISWNTALYFRADKAPFGKAMTQLLEYERINALRIVGDHATHRRTLEVEVRPKVMAHRRLAQAAAAAAATTESNDDHNDDTDKDEAHDLFERYCFTVRRENVLY